MSKRTLIYMFVTLLLGAYLVFAVSMARTEHAAQPYRAIDITVSDTARSGFVNPNDIDRALGGLRASVSTLPRNRVDTRALQQSLLQLPKVENARVTALANGHLSISVTPMVPVARVFDGRRNYYVNAAGKQLPADAVHHLDLPVISGKFPPDTTVACLLPMFKYIHDRPELDALVTSVAFNPRGDIIIIPAVAGHVINFGDTSAVADKFDRLRRFYHDVMPVKGWAYYDTLSVKWRGRMVATKRTKRRLEVNDILNGDGVIDEIVDEGTMVAPVNVNVPDSLKPNV